VTNNPNGPTGRGRGQSQGGGQERRRSSTWPAGDQGVSGSWGRRDDNDPDEPDVWGAPRDDTFGDLSDEWPPDDVMGLRFRCLWRVVGLKGV
jgi:hypothetical protein